MFIPYITIVTCDMNLKNNKFKIVIIKIIGFINSFLIKFK